MILETMESKPKYIRVKEIIEQKIIEGELAPGNFLPSENQLCKSLHVSRNTIRAALNQLRRERIIISRQGQQSIICDPDEKTNKKATKLVWLAMHPITGIEPIYARIYNSLLREAEKHNCSLMYLTLVDGLDTKWFVDHVEDISGVIVAGMQKGAVTPLLEEKLSTIKNIVGIDDITNSPAEKIICTDNYAGGKMAAEYLLKRGYREIALIGVAHSMETYHPFKERIKGFTDVLEENNIQTRKDTLFISADQETYFNTQPYFEHIIKKRPGLEALFSITDDVAVNCLAAARRIGIKVPGDLAIIGFDGLPLENLDVSLTTIAQPTSRIGREVFRELVENSGNAGVMKIKPELISKNSA